LRGHPERDDYNFYQSRCRINVECSFGILVSRFGVLRRPMRNKLSLITKVVAVCMKLHNICIDDNTHLSHPIHNDISTKDIMAPISQNGCAYAPRALKKRQKSKTREDVSDSLHRVMHVRPLRQRARLV